MGVGTHAGHTAEGGANPSRKQLVRQHDIRTLATTSAAAEAEPPPRHATSTPALENTLASALSIVCWNWVALAPLQSLAIAWAKLAAVARAVDCAVERAEPDAKHEGPPLTLAKTLLAAFAKACEMACTYGSHRGRGGAGDQHNGGRCGAWGAVERAQVRRSRREAHLAGGLGVGLAAAGAGGRAGRLAGGKGVGDRHRDRVLGLAGGARVDVNAARGRGLEEGARGGGARERQRQQEEEGDLHGADGRVMSHLPGTRRWASLQGR